MSMNNFKGPYYIFTNKEEKEYEFQYRDGLNIFNPKKICSENPGGFYLADSNNILRFFDKSNSFIREVYIPEDAKFIVSKNIIRTDKIFFGKKISIDDVKMYELFDNIPYDSYRILKYYLKNNNYYVFNNIVIKYKINIKNNGTTIKKLLEYFFNNKYILKYLIKVFNIKIEDDIELFYEILFKVLSSKKTHDIATFLIDNFNIEMNDIIFNYKIESYNCPEDELLEISKNESENYFEFYYLFINFYLNGNISAAEFLLNKFDVKCPPKINNI